MSNIIPIHGTLTFDGVAIRTTTNSDGRPLWLARDVGRALEYSNDGKNLITRIGAEWADEFEEGEEFVRAQEPEISKVSESETLGNSVGYGRAPIWLTEAGLNLVCAKTSKPVGKAFRRFIARVLQPLRAFQGAAPAARPALSSSAADRKIDAMLAREARLTALMKSRALRDFAKSCRRRGVSESAVAVLETKAAEAASGESLARYLPVETEQWWTATEIAQALGATVQRIGLLVTELSIRTDERYARAVTDKATHSDKTVTSYQYNAAGRERIVEAYRAWQRKTGGGSA